MKILFISPLPMPIHGQSLAGQMALEGLSKNNKLTVIDSAFDKSFLGNKLPKIYSPRRISQIFSSILREFPLLWFKRYDIVYMSVGITFRGFMRYAIYMFAAILKCEKYVLHTHGSTFRSMYDELSPLKQRILRYFLKKSKNIIVLGDSLVSMFDGIIDLEKVSVCENGVSKEISISNAELEKKRANLVHKEVKLLFLSNLMVAKGFLELLDAFDIFPDNYILNIAGSLEPNEVLKTKFEEFQAKYPTRIVYHGLVKGENKRKLLCDSDIFVLPSKNEGQPLSILEAYACGCAVVTDCSVGGISDIFEDNVNGISVENSSPESIASGIIVCNEKLSKFSENNIVKSQKYTSQMFCERLYNILAD